MSYRGDHPQDGGILNKDHSLPSVGGGVAGVRWTISRLAPSGKGKTECKETRIWKFCALEISVETSVKPATCKYAVVFRVFRGDSCPTKQTPINHLQVQ